MKNVISVCSTPLCLTSPTPAESMSCLPATGVSGVVQSQVPQIRRHLKSKLTMEEVNQGVVFLCSAGKAMVSHFDQQELLSLSYIPS